MRTASASSGSPARRPGPLDSVLRVRGLAIPGRVMLAPLAGYSDAAFRSICLDWGASFTFTEMVSCEALWRGSVRTARLLRRAPNERLLGIQLFGSDPNGAARALDALRDYTPSLLDLNCGCSVPKILKSSSGAALLRDPHLIERMVRSLTSRVSIPVSVKLRSGWDQSSINFLDTAGAAVAGGASLVTLHPRTRAQGFSGRARWSDIGELKRRIPVPVVGSGDLYSAEDVRRMFEETGCDAVMLARGALGNPFIFADTRALLTGERRPSPPKPAARLEAALEHLDRAVALNGEARACREMRKHLAWYTRGLPGGAGLRRHMATCSSRKRIGQTVRSYLDSYAARS